jgi:acyl-CoA hydrolase
MRDARVTTVREPRICTAEEAASLVSSGQTVAVAQLGAEPVTITAALWARAHELSAVTIVTGMMVTGYPFLKLPAGPFRLRTWFMPGAMLGGSFRDVSADYMPLTWAQTVRWLGRLSPDVALIQVSPADDEGFHSHGVCTSMTPAMIRGARLVIAEVNSQMPRTRGHSLIHRSKIDVAVPADHAIPDFPHREGDETDLRIGALAADFVPNGATLQFGVGTIPGATVRALIGAGRKDLRILSMLTDPAMHLIEAGAGTVDGPSAFVGDILGSQALYRWVDDNPAVSMVPDAVRSHGLESVSRWAPLVSINSALEVDLYGQVNSEVTDGRTVGAIGGGLDFAMAAQMPGGTSVIALRSATRHGGSRIVPVLPAGPVTQPRSLQQFVVTEYGVADLRDKSVRERAVALAGIAHPDHRDALRDAAKRLE